MIKAIVSNEKSKLVQTVLAKTRHGLVRKTILLILYTGGLALSFILAYELRFDFAMSEGFGRQLLRYLPWIVALKLLLLFACGQFEGLLSYFSLPDLGRLFRASSYYFVIVLAIWLASGGRDSSVDPT